ncbi:hypothetical protein GCM10023185_46590 [Hymenobacter saemangeumensis]|uniref:DUF4384 domain-containing protein n=1 Tax=Hymenobacter saemangeumensis TaxID=1084522 RepID=A0ABP8ISY8_9BACT
MRGFQLIGLLALLCFAANAQEYYLSLDQQTLSVKNRNVVVERVVDGRKGNPPLGVAFIGMNNKAAAIKFRYGLEPALTSFVQSQLRARPTDKPVVLCLRELQVRETRDLMRGTGEAELVADVYLRLPDGYHFVQQVGAVAEPYRGLDVTDYHAVQLAEVLRLCLEQLGRADWEAAARQPARTLAELPAELPRAEVGSRNRLVPEILNTAPRKGIFYTFEQFLANRPETLAGLRLDTVSRWFSSRLAKEKWYMVARVRPMHLSGGKEVPLGNSVWGFSDGQSLYVQHNKHFYPLVRQGSFFTFVGEAPMDQTYRVLRSEAGNMGAAGMINVAGAVDHTGEPMAYAIDMRTSKIAPYANLKAPSRIDTAYVYVYLPVQASGSRPVKVYLNDQEVSVLQPGSYLELPWPYHSMPMRLCLGGLAIHNPCQYLVPNTAQLNYLKVNPGHPSAPWQWVPASQGEADLDELDKLKKQR